MKNAALVLGALLVSVVALATPAGAAATPLATVYDSTAAPLPGNFPSVGAEAYAFSEFGDTVTLGGTARRANTVVVTLSSWACQIGSWNANDCLSAPKSTFSMPITLNIYGTPVTELDGTVLPGALLGTVTSTFAIPYRPSANLKKCNASTDPSTLGQWYDKRTASCKNGQAANITFSLKSLQLTLPDSIVVGVAYNTTHYGYNPIGESAACYGTSSGCPYDSLNIALNDTGAPTVGAQNFQGRVFQNAAFRGEYCDSTPTVGVFNLDSLTNECWSGYVPAFRITAH